MSAMHHDTSSDLKVVGKKLKDILEVNEQFGLAINFARTFACTYLDVNLHS